MVKLKISRDIHIPISNYSLARRNKDIAIAYHVINAHNTSQNKGYEKQARGVEYVVEYVYNDDVFFNKISWWPVIFLKLSFTFWEHMKNQIRIIQKQLGRQKQSTKYCRTETNFWTTQIVKKSRKINLQIRFVDLMSILNSSFIEFQAALVNQELYCLLKIVWL